MNDLQRQRDEETRLLHDAEDRLEALRKERDRVLERERSSPGGYHSLADEVPNRTMVKQVSQSVEMNKAISSLERSISSMRRGLAALDREIAFVAEIESPENTLQAARMALGEAEANAAEIKRKRQLITQKLQNIRAEYHADLESAQALESKATDVYSAAVADGDAAGEKAAAAKMHKAATTLQEAQAKQPGMQKVTDALEAERDSLDTQLAEAVALGEEARRAMFRAAALKLGLQWDKVAAELIEIGGKLLAAQQLCGESSKPMEDLLLPLFSAYRARPLGVREVKEVAAGVNGEGLLAA